MDFDFETALTDIIKQARQSMSVTDIVEILEATIDVLEDENQSDEDQGEGQG